MKEDIVIKSWHPFAERFPLLEGEELAAFEASIKETKGNELPILYRVVDGRIQGLDGRNRYRACKKFRIKPKFKQVQVKEQNVKAFVLRANVLRRHMTRELRQILVAELRADGQSTRQIAESIGTSPATVRNDLERAEAGGQFCPPEHVMGTDGKEYKASAPTIIPRLQEQIDAGEVSVKLVPQIADLTKNQQGVMLESLAEMTPEKALMEAQKPTREPGEESPRKAQKNGQEIFPWAPFRSAYGALVREIDRAGNAYHCKETPQAEGLRRSLSEWEKQFKEWVKTVSKKKE